MSLIRRGSIARCVGFGLKDLRVLFNHVRLGHDHDPSFYGVVDYLSNLLDLFYGGLGRISDLAYEA